MAKRQAFPGAAPKQNVFALTMLRAVVVLGVSLWFVWKCWARWQGLSHWSAEDPRRVLARVLPISRASLQREVDRSTPEGFVHRVLRDLLDSDTSGQATASLNDKVTELQYALDQSRGIHKQGTRICISAAVCAALFGVPDHLGAPAAAYVWDLFCLGVGAVGALFCSGLGRRSEGLAKRTRQDYDALMRALTRSLHCL